MTLEKDAPRDTPQLPPRRAIRRIGTANLPPHARPVAPGQERDWPDFPAGGCDPDFPGGGRSRPRSALTRAVDGLRRAVRG